MSYPHVTQFETVDLRASLAARRDRPKRVRDRGARELTNRQQPAADCPASA